MGSVLLSGGKTLETVHLKWEKYEDDVITTFKKNWEDKIINTNIVKEKAKLSFEHCIIHLKKEKSHAVTVILSVQGQLKDFLAYISKVTIGWSSTQAIGLNTYT